MDRSVPAPAATLLDLIASVEAPKGYDTVYGNRKMPRRLTSMTVAEVIADGPRRTEKYGSSAAGRYQFMADTLKGLKAPGDALLDPGMQDRLGFQLLRRRGYDKFMAGTMTVTAFGKALAQEWASFPVLADCKGQKRAVKRGQSFYAGDGKNKSLISPEKVEACLNSIRAVAEVDEPAPTISPVPIALPASPSIPVAKTGWLGRVTGWFAPVPAAPPILAKKGDPGIYDIQSMLLDRGYTELGEHDGAEGPKLHAAAANFRRDNRLPAVPAGKELDAAFRAALPGAPHRPVAAVRTAATAETLRQEGNPVVEQFDGIKKIGAVVAGFAGVGATDQAGLVQGIKETVENAQSIVTSVQSAIVTTMNIIQWSVHHWWLFIIVFVGWQILKASGGVALQVIGYRLGNIQRAGQ